MTRIHFMHTLALAFVFLILGACSIKTAGLVPDAPTKVAHQIDKTVQVMPVQGGRASTFGKEAYITNEQFEEVLRRALSDARVFSAVVTSGNPDLELHSEIITVTTEGGISPTYAIVVQYWLVDPASGAEIWRKGINTRHHVEWNEAFAGATRIIMAVEGATKKNVAKLVQALQQTRLP